jgi:uncharacterized membrane protein
VRADARDALLVAIGGAAAATLLASSTLPVVPRAIGAIALAFALPGAAAVAAFMPRVRWRGSERLTLALSGSMTLSIATAFLLHLSPSGLSASSWAGLLGAWTVAAGLVGWLRAMRGAAPEPVTAVAEPPGASVPADGGSVGSPALTARVLAVSPWSAALLLASGLLVVLAFIIARSGVAFGPTASFSELWLLPQDGERAVRVGVANHEGQTQDYRLIVALDGRRLGDPVELTLPDGGATDQVITLPSGGGRDRVVQVRLWHADESSVGDPLRTVRATLAGKESDP